MNKTAVAQELVKLAKELTAGTWAIPKSLGEVKRLERMIRRMDNGNEPLPGRSDVETIFYGSFGDDELFDEIASAKRVYFMSCAEAIRRKLKVLSNQTDLPDDDNKAMLLRLNEELNG